MISLHYLFVAALAVGCVNAKLSADQLAEIDTAIETLVIPTSRISGFGIGIVEDGEVTFVKGYGHNNISAELPVQENSLFAVGSHAKVSHKGQSIQSR